MVRRHAGAAGFAVLAGVVGAALGYWGWPAPGYAVALGGLTFAASIVAAFAVHLTVADDWALASPSRAVEFAALLIAGGDPATFVAAAAATTRALTERERPRPAVRAISGIATAVAAMQAAGFAHRALAAALNADARPAKAIPLAAAIGAYTAVTLICADVVVPLLVYRRVNDGWPYRLLRGSANYTMAASLGAAIAEIIQQQAWQVAAVAIVPLMLVYRVYAAHVARVDDDQRRREVLEFLDEGMAAVDAAAQITFWSEPLARMLGRSRDQVVGRTLADAVPALGKTSLPACVQTVLMSGESKTIEHVVVDACVYAVRIVPVASGATLLWQNVTARTQSELALRRSEERLALAAEGANDGLWEWNRRTQEMYFSARWKAMLGLPPQSGPGRVEDWFERVHPDDVAGLKNALEAHHGAESDHFSHEHRIRHEDGSFRRVLCRGVSVRGTGRRVVRMAGSLTDVTDRAIAQEQLRTAGVLDPLTGLSNRAEFVELLRKRLEDLKARPARTRFAALYLDLDRFKVVNDSLGHLVGDELLKAVSRRLESCLRDGDALARLGGDEFAILLNGLHEEEQANAIAFRIQKSLGAPFSIGGREVFTSASIGIAFGRTHYHTPDEVMRDADRAMYHAKAGGKARHVLFDADMDARTQDRIGLESDLRRAVDQCDFELHYQPIVLLASGMCVGFESLIRWTRNGEPISPVTFIPMAEELGLIEPVGTWCLQQACATFANWKKRYPSTSLEYVTVNVSSRQLVQQNFMMLVERAIEDSGMRPSDLRLEITETALMDSPTAAARLLQELREFGVKIYLDDFGTGYSSLSHLHRLPVDALKIDRSFVKSLGLPDRPAIVESILALARTMNTSVVAEGIETEVQASELHRLGCTHAQGFLFSRPVPVARAQEIVAGNRPLVANQKRVLDFDSKRVATA